MAVALGIFALMTSELLPVGLLTPVGSDLDVSAGTAGLMLTVPGLVAAAAGPVVAVTAARVDRRVLLAALVGVMAAANLVCAVAPHYAVLPAARVAVGVGVGGFWAVAGGLAVRLVPAEDVPRATAIVFGGVSVASVAGVPAGTLIGDLAGWRAAFAAVGVLGLAALAGLLALVPPLPSRGAVAFRELPRLLRRNAGVRVGVLATFLASPQATSRTDAAAGPGRSAASRAVAAASPAHSARRVPRRCAAVRVPAAKFPAMPATP